MLRSNHEISDALEIALEEALEATTSVIEDYQESIAPEIDLSAADATTEYNAALAEQKSAYEDLIALRNDVDATPNALVNASERLAGANSAVAESLSIMEKAVATEERAQQEFLTGQAAFYDDLADLKEDYSSKLADLQRDEDRAIEDASTDFRRQQADDQRDYQDDLSKINSRAGRERIEASQDLHSDLATVARDAAQDREDQERDHLEKLADIRRRVAQDEADATLDRAREREDIELRFQQRVEDLGRRVSEQFFDTPDVDIPAMLSEAGADTALLEAYNEGLRQLQIERNRDLAGRGDLTMAGPCKI